MTEITKNIFADNCQRYWDAGLPVMPLREYTPNGGRDGGPSGKEPVAASWQQYQGRMPTEAEQTAWKVFHRNGNIGLPLGPQSGLIAIDIDTNDQKIIDAILSVLPASPWKRVGQKGMVLVYRYDGQPIIRIKYTDDEGKTQSLVEMLSAGSQIVLPPSIHPKTVKAYTANCDLVDVLDLVQPLPANTEQRLREVLEKHGFSLKSKGFGSVTNYISSGNRDNQLVSMAGLFAREVLKGNKTLIEACGEIEVAVATFWEKTYGDNIDPRKGPEKLIEFLIRDVTGKGKLLPKGWDEGVSDEQRNAWGLAEFAEGKETLNSTQIKAFFDAHVEKSGMANDPEGFLAIVKQTLLKLANSPEIEPIEEDGLIQHIAATSDKKMTVAAVRRQLALLRQGPIAGLNHAEIAEAVVRDMEEQGGEIRFWSDTLWQWDGGAWAEMNEGEIIKHVIKEYGSYKAATRASDHAGILKTIRGLTSGELASKPRPGVNFVNGFLTEDLELLPHDPAYGMTYTLPYPYLAEKAGQCPRWQQMLLDYWGDDPDYHEKVAALGQAMALTLFGKMPSTQKAVCLFGMPQSGKSQIMEIVQALMPAEAQTSLPPTLWGDKFGPSMLVGKTLNFAGELSEHLLIDSAKFKQIVCGETIDAQFKNGQVFTFRPKAAHWFASNHHPKTRDSSEGFTRRWLFLTFTKIVTDGTKRVLDYHQIVLSEEREAIAAWVAQHMVQLKAQSWTISEPPSSIEQRDLLANELNSVRDFLAVYKDNGWMQIGEKACRHRGDNSNYVTFTSLWNEYRSFCIAHSLIPVGSRVLTKRMTELQGRFGFKPDKVASGDYSIQVFRYIVITKGEKKAA